VNKLGTIFVISILLSSSVTAFADKSDGTVDSFQKISETQGGFGDIFGGPLNDDDEFGRAVTNLGDVDGDNVTDLAVGVQHDNDGQFHSGAVWILFLNSDGTVKAKQKISNTAGGFTGILDNQDLFGAGVAGLGDLDGDGIPDLAVGARNDDDGGNDKGAVWILFLNSDGTVKSHQKISDTEGGFTGVLASNTRFGESVANLGDVDGDGVQDIAMGAQSDDSSRGAVWILFLNSDGTVKSHQKILDTEGGFNGILDIGDDFGIAVAGLGNLDGDSVPDLAVGADGDDDGGNDKGAVWILFLNSDGTVKSHQKISNTEGGFTGVLDNEDQFGFSGAGLGDLDGDAIPDLAVGALFDDDGGLDTGAFYILFLNGDGTVKSHQKISDTEGGFTGVINTGDHFGFSITSVGDLDGDMALDLAVGANRDDDGGNNQGAVWILFLNAQQVIGGILLPIETTSLILAGAQSFSWMIPVLLSGIGIGLFVVSRKS